MAIDMTDKKISDVFINNSEIMDDTPQSGVSAIYLNTGDSDNVQKNIRAIILNTAPTGKNKVMFYL